MMSQGASQRFSARGLLRFFAFSDHQIARFARRARRFVLDFEVPAPRVLVRPLLGFYLSVVKLWFFLKRKFICEPFLKAYCTTYGKRVKTDVFIPYVSGIGDLHLGDDVYLTGKISLVFGFRFDDRPSIIVGDHTGLGHGVTIVASRGVRIGRNCIISPGVMIADSGGHPVDPASRLAGLPPFPEEIRPIVIEDNVWVGTGSFVLPGVTIGEGSVISAGSLVRRSVPPYSLVMGNPAKVVAPLPRPTAAVAPAPSVPSGSPMSGAADLAATSLA